MTESEILTGGIIILSLFSFWQATQLVFMTLRNNSQAKIIEEYCEEINRLRAIVKQCDEDRRGIISRVGKN